MAVTDTSFLVALVDEDDKFHKQALAKLPAGERLFVPWEIWIEFSQWVMRYAPERSRADILESVSTGPFQVRPIVDLEASKRLVGAGDAIHVRLARKGFATLTLFDLVVCWASQRLHERIFTFDLGIEYAVRAKLFPGASVG